MRENHPNGQLAVEQYALEKKLHGPSSYFSEEGQLLSQHWFIRGKREGKAISYTSEGKVAKIQRYREGVWQGNQETFYPDGTLKAVLPYAMGKLHGEVRLYYPTGQLKRQLYFVNGKRDGVEKIWNELGTLLIEAEFDRDEPKGTARQWHENGIMALEIVFESDPRNFLIREWDAAGSPYLLERRVTGDYFDQVAQQTNKLTNTLSEVVRQVDSLKPLVDTILGVKDKNKGSEEPPLMAVQEIQKEIENLKRISKKLIDESGFQSTHEDERFWKGPSARREVEQQVQLMSTDISKEINKIQNSLVVTLGFLSKKLKDIEEKNREKEKKSEKKEQGKDGSV